MLLITLLWTCAWSRQIAAHDLDMCLRMCLDVCLGVCLERHKAYAFQFDNGESHRYSYEAAGKLVNTANAEEQLEEKLRHAELLRDQSTSAMIFTAPTIKRYQDAHDKPASPTSTSLMKRPVRSGLRAINAIEAASARGKARINEAAHLTTHRPPNID